MASAGVNVFRWSALAVGAFYGFSHQRTITATQKAQHEQNIWDGKQKLIDNAKSEFAKKHKPAPTSGDDVITDVNSPSFDLEKMLEKVSKDSP